MNNEQQTPQAVVFGTGPLGLAVMEELVARGRTVRMVNRRGRVDEALPAGVSVVAADATDAEQVARVCADTAVVFHCAQPGYTSWPTQFPPITTGILEGVAQTNAKLVFGDNLYMYGSTDGQPVHEGLPYAATGHKGRTRAEMAKQLLAAHEHGRVQVTIGRASDFYGPRVLGSAVGDIVFAAALAGKTVNVLGRPELPHTFTYIKDFAWGLVTLSEHDEAYGRAWHVPSAPTISTNDFLKLVEEAVGQPLKSRAGGKLMLTLLGLFVPEMREMKEIFYEFDEPYVVDHTQFATAFGQNATPHKQAIAETVAWYRAHLASK
ncbi:MAG: NAD-dependent epimerase/dehydratase family protein [Anaerolineales bacterium]|nr:NAD-dependent epimerase/dehydratase family protein [Anaerolineales bacterium]